MLSACRFQSFLFSSIVKLCQLTTVFFTRENNKKEIDLPARSTFILSPTMPHTAASYLLTHDAPNNCYQQNPMGKS